MSPGTGWRRSDREPPPDSAAHVLVWLPDVQRREERPAVAVTTGARLRRIIETEDRRYWWHPWVPDADAVGVPGVPPALAAAWMRPGD